MRPSGVTPKRELFETAVIFVVALQVSLNFQIATADVRGDLVFSPAMWRHALECLALCLGPLSAWIVTGGDGVPILVSPLASPCAFLLGVALARRSVALFVLFDVLWFVYGYFYTVAIWV